MSMRHTKRNTLREISETEIERGQDRKTERLVIILC